MKVITLIGADASGKDTQIAHLKETFLNQKKRVQVITIWDSLADFSEIKDKKTLQETVETFLLKFESHARSFFLMACLKNSMEKIDRSNDIVLLNGFYHKYWASEMAYGVESDLWKLNSHQFIDSDFYFYLKTPVEICSQRKTHWSKYEQGLGQFNKSERISREVFQKRLHQHLESLTNQIKNLHTIDGSRDEQTVLKDILGHL